MELLASSKRLNTHIPGGIGAPAFVILVHIKRVDALLAVHHRRLPSAPCALVRHRALARGVDDLVRGTHPSEFGGVVVFRLVQGKARDHHRFADCIRVRLGFVGLAGGRDMQACAVDRQMMV